MRRGFSTPLVIAIMAFAVVSFLFLIDTSINPDGSKKTGETTTNTDTANLNSSTNQNVNTATNNNTNTNADPTAGWKTYTNTTLGFSTNYPADWIVTECDDIYLSFDTKRHVCDSEYVSGFNVKKINPDDIFVQIEATKTQWTNVRDESISIDGIDAQRISGVSDLFGDPGWYQDIVYVTINGDAMLFHYLEKPSDAPPNLLNFNAFLSSIAFTI